MLDLTLILTRCSQVFRLTNDDSAIMAQEALQRLRDGNQRFVSGVHSVDSLLSHSESRRRELVAEQHPFAIVLGCSDSRVPAEIVFDQGLGDLFVIRVAGNVVAQSQIGSIEFAVSHFNTRLVVVLGHSDCGAVGATVKQLKQGTTQSSSNISAIVNRIKPAVTDLIESGCQLDQESLMRQAVRANVRASVNQLRNGSVLLESVIHKGELVVVGAEYSLETGIVDFFDGV